MGRGDVCFYRLKTSCGILKVDIEGFYDKA
jgi:hypothetical protein